MALKQYVTDEKDYLVSLRRYFHAHPEVSLKEYNTCKKIEEELDKIGLLHKRVGETGVYAWIDGEKGEGKTIALRADMDALAMEDLKMTSLRSQFGFFIKPTQYKRQNPEVLVRLGNNRKVVFHRYYFDNGYMANLVYQVEDDQIEFCQSSVFKSWDNGEYHITYDTPVTEDVEDINTRKELLSFLRRVEELPSVK